MALARSKSSNRRCRSVKKRVEILAFFEDCSLRLPTASMKSPPGNRSLCRTSQAVNEKELTLVAAKTSASHIAFSIHCLVLEGEVIRG
jgi:hypothetical protein